MNYKEGSSIGDLEKFSKENGCSLAVACAAYDSPLIKNPTCWDSPTDIGDIKDIGSANLVSRESKDLLSRWTIINSDMINFPPSTAFLHCLGSVSAALNKGFKIKYYNKSIPANLYVITSQPPSTGKTAINDAFFSPVENAYAEESDRTQIERMQLEKSISDCESRLDKLLTVKSSANDYELIELADKIKFMQARLEKIPKWRCNLTDTTIEAAEGVASRQGGLYNIITDEADAINVVTGGVYGNSQNKKNLSLILNAWDGGKVESARVGRDGISCHVRASISVLAQDDAVDTILSSGESGRGITQRFLLLSEPNLLGKRKGTIYNKEVFRSTEKEYGYMISEILKESDAVIEFSKDSLKYLKITKDRIEPHMDDDGKYANSTVRGFMGKAEKHISKIAVILHCSEQWGEKGDRSKVVQIQTIVRASALFHELAERFLHAADYHGYTGETSEIQKLIDHITQKAEKGVLKMSLRSLRDNIKGVKPFKGTPKLTERLKEKILPILQKRNYIVLDRDTIHINPRLK